MPSRESTILETQIATVDEKSAQANKLFQSIDRNNDGSISEEEFTKAFDILQRVVRQNHDEIQQGRKRIKLLCVMLVFAGFIVSFVLAGNMGLMYMLLQMTKEVQLSKSNDMSSTDGSIMMDRNGEVVSTATTNQYFDDITELPLLGPTFDYMSIARLQLPELEYLPEFAINQTVMHGYRVEGYRWYTLTDMDLELSMDTTVQITANGVSRARTSQLNEALYALGGSSSSSLSRRKLSSTVQSVAVQSASGNVVVQETSSTTSGSRVCPATLTDFNKNRNCYNVGARKCIKCAGQASTNGNLYGTGTPLGNSPGSGSSGGASTTSRLCPRTLEDIKNKRTCWQQNGNKCVKCKPDANDDDDYLVGNGATSRVCPANTADANANRNCYNVWKKECVVCSGSFKDVENDDN